MNDKVALHDMTLTDLSQGLRDKHFSSSELTKHFLERIEQQDPQYNSFITVTSDQAIKQAQAADERLASGNAPLLCGIPVAHKDIFCTQGVKTSCASKMLDNFVPPYNAAVVDNFEKNGAVMLGKTNMDEFAMGSSNENSYYGPVKNPWATDSVPGGSSGGSAVSVAARLAPAATATDTGGSIRQPAALCGVTGLKPTYGRVSRWGMIAYASSLDQGGPITRTAEDAALMLNVMAGFDQRDSTCIDLEVPDYTKALNNSIAGLKIGVPKEYFGEGLDPAIGAAVETAIKQYEKMGAVISEISLPHTQLSVPAYYVIAPAEASANLSRYDGVRYGYRCENPRDLQDLYMRSRGEGFGDEVKRRILVGAYALSAGYYDAYYNKAQQVRRLVKQDYNEAFKNVDIILGPTTPSPAFKFGEKSQDPTAMYLEDIYTISANLAGLPGISLPCGNTAGKPVGLQLISDAFTEERLLNAAHQFQQHTDHHLQAPADSANA